MVHTNFLNEEESNCNTVNFKQKYKDEMCSDFLYKKQKVNPKAQFNDYIYSEGLYHLAELLDFHDKTLKYYGLPEPMVKIDTKVPAIVDVLTHWVLFIPLCYFLGIFLGYGYWGAWVSFGAHLTFFAVFVYSRFKKGRWKKIKF